MSDGLHPDVQQARADWAARPYSHTTAPTAVFNAMAGCDDSAGFDEMDCYQIDSGVDVQSVEADPAEWTADSRRFELCVFTPDYAYRVSGNDWGETFASAIPRTGDILTTQYPAATEQSAPAAVQDALAHDSRCTTRGITADSFPTCYALPDDAPGAFLLYSDDGFAARAKPLMDEHESDTTIYRIALQATAARGLKKLHTSNDE